MNDKETDIAWVDADRDYKLGLFDGKLKARNPKGRVLASVPKWLRDSEAGESLSALADWLTEHRLECIHTIERWMLRSLPTPTSIIKAVWADPDWRDNLEGLVVVPADHDGHFDTDNAGLLRDVDADKGLGVIDLDGESRWIDSECFGIPHPILIADLVELRELAADLGIEQSIDQIYRPIHEPSPAQQRAVRISDFADGHFAQFNHAVSLSRRHGYAVRGGSACCTVWEGGEQYEARFDLGESNTDWPTDTGDLMFVDAEQKAISIAEVGPVTFSEGMRMAATIYAGRVVQDED
ncbi:MAG: hypothetical protein CSB44_01640 [Gammaproteobacteria bacterium]|nr:MAG: hypothetical protein CSB44_01640 [Gammaproteobacteria bacterium]